MRGTADPKVSAEGGGDAPSVRAEIPPGARGTCHGEHPGCTEQYSEEI